MKLCNTATLAAVVAYNHQQVGLGTLRTQTKFWKAVSVSQSLHCITISRFLHITSVLIV
jgi:hypothetical protein